MHAAVQDNYPHTSYTALDLSPYYLYEARTNIKEWHRLRQPKLSMGGVDGSGAHFLQGAAEDIPQPAASHHVVSSLPASVIPYMSINIDTMMHLDNTQCRHCVCLHLVLCAYVQYVCSQNLRLSTLGHLHTSSVLELHAHCPVKSQSCCGKVVALGYRVSALPQRK